MIPIIVSEDLILIAGERRYRAHELLNKTTINAIVQTNKEINHRVFEILENLERKEFTWQEKALAMEDLHLMFAATTDGKWSERKTAEKAGLSSGGVNTDLNLAEALKADPEMFKGCRTREQALKTLQKYHIDETKAEIALRASKSNYGKKAKNHVFLGDCLNLITKLPVGIVNALVSDPFYGLDIGNVKKFTSDRPKDKIYEDDVDTYFETMAELIEKADKVLAKDSWIAMFCRYENFEWLKSKFEAIGFNCDSLPGIWHRTGAFGQTNQPDKRFARSYEVFIYGFRGDVALVKQGQSNILSFAGVVPSDKDHPVQKPLGLMEELIGRLCLPGQVILDPMCGSGTTGVAAIKKGCNPILFELEEKYYNVALTNMADVLNMKDAGKLDLVTR